MQWETRPRPGATLPQWRGLAAPAAHRTPAAPNWPAAHLLDALPIPGERLATAPDGVHGMLCRLAHAGPSTIGGAGGSGAGTKARTCSPAVVVTRQLPVGPLCMTCPVCGLKKLERRRQVLRLAA